MAQITTKIEEYSPLRLKARHQKVFELSIMKENMALE